MIRAILPSPTRPDALAPRFTPSATPAPTSPAAPSTDHPAAALGALFDGSLPTSREVLDRAAALGLSDAALGLEISASKSPSEAASRLSALGLLGPRETGLAGSKEKDFRFLLKRLWRKAAPSVPAPFEIDDSFGVTALKVERDGVTYFIHAVNHGKYSPPHRAAVLSLVRRVAAAGHALYSEQNSPVYYGYKTGLETLDHAAGASAWSAPVPVAPAAPDDTPATLLFRHAADWAVALGGALAALAWAIVVPAAPVAWILLAAFGAYVWLRMTAGLPVMRWERFLLAAAARAEGREDEAAQYADEAANFYAAKPDLEILRGLELPQPLGAQDADPYSARSRAIADAVAADAAASGASAVHIVTGHYHAHEMAWRLANGPIDSQSKLGGIP